MEAIFMTGPSSVQVDGGADKWGSNLGHPSEQCIADELWGALRHVACDPVPVVVDDQRRFDADADRLRERAPWVEGAAGGWVYR
jgi:hypothetical protein